MCGGGGGDGGAGEIRRQESERNYRTAAATRAINAMFGIDNPSLYAPTKFGSGYALGDARTSNQPAVTSPRDYGSTPWEIMRNPAFWAGPQAPQPGADLGTAQRNRESRDQLYSTTTDDIVNYLRSQLDEYHTDANSRAKYALARRGLSGGQADINLRDKVQRTYDRGVLDVRNQADSSVAGLRSSDEQARLNLIQQIQNGMDSNTAVSSATNMLRNNADTALSNARTQQVANLFQQLDQLYGTQQYVEGRNQAYAPTRNTGAIINPQSYSGSIYRG